MTYGRMTTMASPSETAIRHHCRLSIETMHPRFGWADQRAGFSVVLTVNSGFE